MLRDFDDDAGRYYEEVLEEIDAHARIQPRHSAQFPDIQWLFPCRKFFLHFISQMLGPCYSDKVVKQRGQGGGGSIRAGDDREETI